MQSVILKKLIVLIGLSLTINSYADDDIISSPAEEVVYVEEDLSENNSDFESNSESEYYQDINDNIIDSDNDINDLSLDDDPGHSEDRTPFEDENNVLEEETISPVLDQDIIDGLLSLNDNMDNQDTNLIIESLEENENKNIDEVLTDDSEIEMDDIKSDNIDSSSSGGIIELLKNLLLKNDNDTPTEIHLADAPSMLRASGDTYHKNVVVYHGTFNNYDADLVVPYNGYSSLDIINNVIVNVGSSSVTGRILYDGDVLSPSDYDTYSYVMNPVYGSTTNVYNYGSFNYRRHYYLQSYAGGQRITYDDMYGNFYVDSVDVYYSASERVYYILLVILLFMGVNALWSRKH